MNTPTLLGPNAKPVVNLGEAGAWKHRVIRGIHCSFKWLDLTAFGGEGVTACMCLFRPGSMSRGAYVIPQANAFLFGDRNGNPLPNLLTTAFQIAQDLGFDLRDRSAIKTVIDIVIEALPDLITMPSEAPNSTEVLVANAVHGIEATARINGQKVHEEFL